MIHTRFVLRVPAIAIQIPEDPERAKTIAKHVPGAKFIGGPRNPISFPNNRGRGRQRAFVGDWIVETNGSFVKVLNSEFQSIYVPEANS